MSANAEATAIDCVWDVTVKVPGKEQKSVVTLKSDGETLTGTQVNVELTLAPLPSPRPVTNQVRLLGLYQILEAFPVLQGRPVWRHRVKAVFPPSIEREPRHLRLVANND